MTEGPRYFAELNASVGDYVDFGPFPSATSALEWVHANIGKRAEQIDRDALSPSTDDAGRRLRPVCKRESRRSKPMQYGGVRRQVHGEIDPEWDGPLVRLRRVAR